MTEADNSYIIKTISNFINSNQVFTDITVQEDRKMNFVTPSGVIQDDHWVTHEDINLFAQLMVENETDPEFAEIINKQGLRQLLLQRKEAIDKTLTLMDCQLRINFFLHDLGRLALSVRKHDLKVPSIQQHTMPGKTLEYLSRVQAGLILFYGRTNSGKTTTIKGLLEKINSSQQGHIVTIEDPIEYSMESNKCMISSKQIGVDVASYASGLRDALRQNPTHVMVGEIRDRATMETALHGAESGISLIATIHARDPATALWKILKWFPENSEQTAFSLANSLRAMVGCTMLPNEAKDAFLVTTEYLLNEPLHPTGALINKAISSATPTSLQSLNDIMSEDYPANKGLHRQLNDSLFKLYSMGMVSKEAAICASNNPTALSGRIFSHITKT
jgi:twitching motility protein PilT